MSGSFSLGGTDLSTYGLYLLRDSQRQLLPPPRLRQATFIGYDGAKDFDAQYEPRAWNLQCIVVGTSISDLQSKLTSLSRILDPMLGLQALIFDIQTDRYYNVKVVAAPEYSYDGFSARFQLPMMAPVPFGLDNSLTESPHTITTNPQTVTENVGGDYYAIPEWHLLADQELASADITISNGTTGEEFIWSGTLGNGETLIVYSETFYVTKEGVASMSAISGQFPRLKGNTLNSIQLSDFHGTCTIKYRERYLT